MKIFSIIYLITLMLPAFSMGNRALFPGNPLSPTERQHINDIEETTGKINQLSGPLGYEDQQMMEEKEIPEEEEGQKEIQKREDNKVEEVKRESPTRPKVHHE